MRRQSGGCVIAALVAAFAAQSAFAQVARVTIAVKNVQSGQASAPRHHVIAGQQLAGDSALITGRAFAGHLHRTDGNRQPLAAVRHFE